MPTIAWADMLVGFAGIAALVSSVRFFNPRGLAAILDRTPPNPARTGMHKRDTYEKASELFERIAQDYFKEIPVGVVVFGEDLRVHWSSAQARYLLKGLSDGQSVWDALPADMVDGVQECWRDGLNTDIGKVEVPLRARAVLMDDRGEQPYGVALFVWETAKSAPASDLQQYRHMAAVGTHVAAIAHDIRNPLVALKAFSDLLPSKWDDPEFRDKFAKMALGQVQLLQGMVDDLLDYARPKRPDLLPGSPLLPLTEALDILAIRMKESKIQIRQMGKALPRARIDSLQLRRVFLNVLGNAVEAMPKGGTITVVSRRKGDTMEISIADTGSGVAAQDLPLIFEPFYSTKGKGSGLGLAISKRIVEEHGGTISLRRVRDGTVCLIALPVAEDEPKPRRIRVRK